MSICFRLAVTASSVAILLTTLAAQEQQQPDHRQSWVVMFGDRGFDLTAFRRANQQRRSAAEVAVIVEDLEAQVRRDQAGFVEFVDRLGGQVTERWWLINGCAIELPAERLDAVRAHPRVRSVHQNRYLKPGWIKTATNGKNHHVDGLHARGIKGKGVSIAIIDSGLDVDMNKLARPHRTFYLKGDSKNTAGGGIKGSRMLANVKVGVQSADDILGHGTMVAAVAGGEVWGTANGDPGHAPEAGIVGYSIADTTTGAALLTTMISAFQQMARDKVKYKIAVGNLSYDGSAIPNWPEQQAIDSAVLNADIFVAVLGGNGGSSTHYSHAATNVLAVGAVHADVHGVASFSSRGPIAIGRTFPDIVANGVNIIGPLADNEALDRVRSGTSNAAPQVAGAAALYRSLKSSASALETRAALLATTQDIGYDNPAPPFSSANAYGQGYLRDDQLVKVAQGGGMVQNSTMTVATKTRSYQFLVTAGKFYAAAVAWYRYDVTINTGWSNLALSVDQGSTNLGRSDAMLNTYEKVQFQATKTGVVTVTVTTNTLEARVATLPFSLVMTESLPFRKKVFGTVTRFGQNCLGSLKLAGRAVGPIIGLSGALAIGKSSVVVLDLLLPRTPVVLVAGLSSIAWGSLKLPIDLTGLGGTGCSIYTSLDLLIPLQASAGPIGRASLAFTVPNNSAFTGLAFYLQGAAHDPVANPMRMTTTSGLAATIGN